MHPAYVTLTALHMRGDINFILLLTPDSVGVSRKSVAVCGI